MNFIKISSRLIFNGYQKRFFSTGLMSYTKLPEEALQDGKFMIRNPDFVPEKYILKKVNMGNHITLEELSKKLDVDREELKKNIEFLVGQKLSKDDKTTQVDFQKLTRQQVASVSQLFGAILSDPQAVYQSKPNKKPVITIMGHVDHGKTTLLDTLRNSQIAKGEFGGITQKIGAFHVITKDGQRITFIDTPGHEAFANMRVRGAQFTDIIILVVSALDGVQPQTLEVISIAYNFRIPLLVAVNKIDVQGANPEDVEKQLIEQGRLALEGYGDGNIPIVHISGKTGLNLDLLLELIQFQGEIMELKSIRAKQAEGFILEARQQGELDGKGSTALIQSGTLKQGQFIIIGDQYSKVRLIKDDLNKILTEAYPSYAVEIFGLNRTPQAGDYFFSVENETLAKLIANRKQQLTDQKKLTEAKLIDGQAGKIKIENRKEKKKIYGDENLLKLKLKQAEELIVQKIKELQLETQKEQTFFNSAQDEENYNKASIEKLEEIVKLEKSLKDQQQYITEMIGEDEDKKQKTLKLIVKGPDYGTVESLELLINRVINEQNLTNEDIQLVSQGVGKISIKDIKDAKAYDAQILCMNVEVNQEVARLARELGIILRQHQIIYALIDDLKIVIKEIYENSKEKNKLKILGSGVILQVFDVKLKKGQRKVYGTVVRTGKIIKSNRFRILRKEEVIYKDLEIVNLKNFKDEVTSVIEGKECGISFIQEVELIQGDILEGYNLQTQKQ